MSFIAAKIQQNCTGTGNYNSKATRQGIICAGEDQKFLTKISSAIGLWCGSKFFCRMPYIIRNCLKKLELKTFNLVGKRTPQSVSHYRFPFLDI